MLVLLKYDEGENIRTLLDSCYVVIVMHDVDFYWVNLESPWILQSWKIFLAARRRERKKKSCEKSVFPHPPDL